MLGAARHREEALAGYQKSIAIAEKLAAADPGNALWQTDLVVSLYKVSTVGEAKEANLAKELDILRRLDAIAALSADQKSRIPTIEDELKNGKPG